MTNLFLGIIAWVTTIFGILALFGAYGLDNPSPKDIQARCVEHGRVSGVAQRQFPFSDVIVVCKDGSVFEGKR